MPETTPPIVETHSVIRLRYRALWMICLALLGILLTLHIISYFIAVPKGYILIFFLPMFLLQALAIIDYNVKSGNTQRKKRGGPLIEIQIRP